MARRKRPTKGEKPDVQTAIPFHEAPAPSEELRVFPFELRPGDLVNGDGREWEVAGQPAGYRHGINVASSATMHVGDLDRQSTSQGNRWTALVTITVHNSSHAPAANRHRHQQLEQRRQRQAADAFRYLADGLPAGALRPRPRVSVPTPTYDFTSNARGPGR